MKNECQLNFVNFFLKIWSPWIVYSLTYSGVLLIATVNIFHFGLFYVKSPMVGTVLVNWTCHVLLNYIANSPQPLAICALL